MENMSCATTGPKPRKSASVIQFGGLDNIHSFILRKPSGGKLRGTRKLESFDGMNVGEYTCYANFGIDRNLD
jgi:hypothetical protein